MLARHGVAGRLGGDEFGVWVRESEEAGRRTAAAMVEDVAAALPVELVTADPPVGLSVGMAVDAARRRRGDGPDRGRRPRPLRRQARRRPPRATR